MGMICSHCGEVSREEWPYCPYCGEKLFPSSSDVVHSIPDEELRAYVGPNSEKYSNKFKKFKVKGVDSFALTWHWPAFFAGCWWMLYRKMYFWSFIAFFIWMLPHMALPAMVVWGVVGNYLYYLQVRRKILEYKDQYRGTNSPGVLAEWGGVNRWVWVVGVMLSL